MNEMLDEQLLRRALTAFADCRAPARRVKRSPVRSLRFGVVLAFAALVIAGSAVAAQRVVLQPLGVFDSDAQSAPARDRAFVSAINSSDMPSKIVSAGLVLQRSEPNGEVRVYATANADGSHGIGISEDGNPQGYGCCASARGVQTPISVGLQLSRSIGPVAYPDVWAGWVGERTVSVSLLYSDGTSDQADVEGGYFLAADHAPAGAQPVALIARAGDGSELGRLAITRG